MIWSNLLLLLKIESNWLYFDIFGNGKFSFIIVFEYLLKVELKPRWVGG